MKILVVGSGTAGLISALILKKFLNAQVDIVYSKDIGIIGVGEGSTEHFQDFMTFVGINQFEILKECDATLKAGIMFENWSEKNYFHSVASPFNSKIAQYPYIYAKQISSGSSHFGTRMIWNNKLESWYLNKIEVPPVNQYHFNTYKLNEFLKSKATQFKIKLFEDEIEDVVLKNNGEIKFLKGKKSQYNYDFYIDATGFKKLLIGKMNSKWISFNKYLKMKSAIVFPTEDEEEYNLWTLTKAMDYGWRFKIPTWGRHGNGYIFDSDYITADKAKEEIDKEFGYDVEISKEFKFDPGYLENVWIKNCIAIGLSGSFVEPLEATSIGTTIQQSYLLMHKIMNYSEKDIIEYNNSFKSIMDNIRDFVVLHYLTKKQNTVFWKDVKNNELPESLQNNLEIWKNKIPIREHFSNQSSYSLFWEDNFTLVLNGLGLFNIESIKKEYSALTDNFKSLANNLVEEQTIKENNQNYISHKKYIEIIRKYL